MSAILTGPPSWHLSSRPTDEALQELAGSHDDVAGFADRLDKRAGRTVGDDPRLAELLVVDDADHADLDDVAQRVGLLA